MSINVKAKEGRIARTSPNGQFIPDDRYIAVELTAYVKRLLNHHKDIVQEEPKQSAPSTKPVTKHTEKSVTKEDS